MSDQENNHSFAVGKKDASPRAVSQLARGAGDGMDMEQHPEWMTLARLTLRVKVEIPLPHFKVRDLLGLSGGQLVLTEWSSTADVPLIVGSAHLSWSEFEVVEQRMAVRMTRLG